MSSSNALTIAREKLQAADVPLLLRVSYYLRISCAALASDDMRYSSLLKDLYAQNPAWLTTCAVTPAGVLVSSDRSIQTLLAPITALHHVEPRTKASVPMAA